MTRVKIIITVCFSMMALGLFGQHQFLEEFPHLEKHHFKEPKSELFYGMGLAPIGMMGTRLFLSANVFQIHQISPNFDWEIISASLGQVIGQEAFAKSMHFTIRTIPKYRIFDFLSIGPVLGHEFVRYSNVTARLYKNTYVTPYDTLTAKGWIYGAVLSEMFKVAKDKYLKVNQLFFKQNFSVKESSFDWIYLYKNEELKVEDNLELIQPNWVIMLEFSYIF